MSETKPAGTSIPRKSSTSPLKGPLPYRRVRGRGVAQIVVNAEDADEVDPAWYANHQIGLLLIGDAAKLAGVNTRTLRAATDRGELPAYITGGETRRYRKEDALAWAQPIITADE